MGNKIISKQLNNLYYQISGDLPPTGNSMMKVFPLEAGLGKTTIAMDALWALHEEGHTSKSLMVVPQIDDAYKLAKELKGISFVLHHKNRDRIDNKTIMDTPVIIITHAMYAQLCDIKKNKQPRYQSILDGRENLIIDEEIQIEKFIKVNMSDYLKVRNSIAQIDCTLINGFEKVFSEIYNKLVDMVDGGCSLCILKSKPLEVGEESIFNKLISKVQSKLGNYGFFSFLSSIQNEQENYLFAENYYDLLNTLESLIKLRKSPFCVCSGNAILCVDRDIQYKFLENNVLLDASASISSKYKHMNMMMIIPMERIVSHKDWTLNVCYVNTSGNAKRENINIYHDAAGLIENICSNPNNKLLVVGSATDVGKKEDPIGKLQRLYPELCLRYSKRLSFENFASTRGKNEWADFNCCLIIHTPYLDGYLYPLLLNFYQPEIPLTDADLKIRYSPKEMRTYFTNKALDDLRESMLATSIYQAIKRVNRSDDEGAQVFLLSSNRNMIKTIENNMLDIKVQEFKLPCQIKKRNYKRIKESDAVIKLRQLFAEMVEGKHRIHECTGMPGHYTKKWCMKMTGLPNINFSRHLKSLRSEMIKMGISNNQHKIIVSKFAEKD